MSLQLTLLRLQLMREDLKAYNPDQERDDNGRFGSGAGSAHVFTSMAQSSQLSFESHVDKPVGKLSLTETREALAHLNVADAMTDMDPDAFVGVSHSRGKLMQRLRKLTGKTDKELTTMINSDAAAVGSKV